MIRWRPETDIKGAQGPEQGQAAVHCIPSAALRKLPVSSLTKPSTDHKAPKWAGHPLYAENLWDAIFCLAKLAGMLNIINFYTKHVLLFFFNVQLPNHQNHSRAQSDVPENT